MNEQFTAIVYYKDEQIATRPGNDIDKLYAWMLIQANGYVSEIRGEIIDNSSKKIIRSFCKTSVE